MVDRRGQDPYYNSGGRGSHPAGAPGASAAWTSSYLPPEQARQYIEAANAFNTTAAAAYVQQFSNYGAHAQAQAAVAHAAQAAHGAHGAHGAGFVPPAIGGANSGHNPGKGPPGVGAYSAPYGAYNQQQSAPAHHGLGQPAIGNDFRPLPAHSPLPAHVRSSSTGSSSPGNASPLPAHMRTHPYQSSYQNLAPGHSPYLPMSSMHPGYMPSPTNGPYHAHAAAAPTPPAKVNGHGATPAPAHAKSNGGTNSYSNHNSYPPQNFGVSRETNHSVNKSYHHPHHSSNGPAPATNQNSYNSYQPRGPTIDATSSPSSAGANSQNGFAKEPEKSSVSSAVGAVDLTQLQSNATPPPSQAAP